MEAEHPTEHETPRPEYPRCLVANVAWRVYRGHQAREIREGTKHFSPGTKVVVLKSYGGGTLNILGPARKSRRLIDINIGTEYLHNFRVQTVGKPSLLEKIARASAPLVDSERVDGLALFFGHHYWTHTLVGRLSQGLDLELDGVVFRDLRRGIERDFQDTFWEWRKQHTDASEIVAAEATARALIENLPLEDYPERVVLALEKAAVLREEWKDERYGRHCE